MAVVQVGKDGNAPAGTKVGDHVVTAGGTYQVLDSNIYSKMSADQLAAAGVGYNPSSGLYSKKVDDIDKTTIANNVTQNYNGNNIKNYDTTSLENWRTNQQKQINASLESAYYTDRQNLANTYNKTMTDYTQQMNNVKADYLDNITNLYDETYYNNAKALEHAASRGLASSGLGNAMQVSALANASKQNAQYRAKRNTDLNNIEAAMIGLSNEYNVNLDTLVSKLNSDKISKLSEAEVAYLNALMEYEKSYTDTLNSAYMTQAQWANDALQAQLQRDWNAGEAEKEREFQREMQQLGGSGYSYGGYGGYSRGGYSSRGYGGYSSGADYGDMTMAEYYAAVALNGNYGKFTEADQKAILANAADNNTAGVIASISDAKKKQRGEKPVPSEATKKAVSNSSSSSSNNKGTTSHKGGGAGASIDKDKTTKKEQKQKAQNSTVKKKGSAGGLF